jgi:Mn2+/Fe2+ NRAMP family transporter
MGVLLTLISGLVVWVVLWALGVKSFDAFMITILMLVLAAAGYMLGPHLPGRQRRD